VQVALGSRFRRNERKDADRLERKVVELEYALR